jgi:hypothetical protein
LKYQPPRSPVSFNRPISRPSSANPFDQPQPGIHSTGYPIPAPGAAHPARGAGGSNTNSPSRTTQPGIETEPVPLLRPQPSNYDPASYSPDTPNGAHPTSSRDGNPAGTHNHARMDSASSGWKGPHWHGGASGTGGYSPAAGAAAGVRQDRWWRALCAWGDDLDDGGEDGQVSSVSNDWRELQMLIFRSYRPVGRILSNNVFCDGLSSCMTSSLSSMGGGRLGR